jgi:hypothetical protein
LLFSVWIARTHDHSAKLQVHLTLANSYWNYLLCSISVLGVANDGWAYKESYNECHYFLCVLHWQCCWAVHVDS